MTMPHLMTLKTSQLNPFQRKIFQDRASSLLLASSGVGTGKTTIGAVKAIDLALRNRGVPGIIIAKSWTSLTRTCLGAINRLLPREHRRQIVDPQGDRYITFDGETPVYLCTASRPDLWDGLDVGWYWSDEGRHYAREAHEILIARKRIKCPVPQGYYTTTPEIGWLSEEFDTGKPGRRVVFGSTYENAANLHPDYIANLETSYSARLQKAMLHGQFVILEGAVFDAFDGSPTSQWVIDYDHTKHVDKKTFLFIDPGYRRAAVLWVRELAPLTWVCFHQYMPESQSMETTVRVINGYNQKHGIKVDEIWVDPAADAKEQATEVNVIQCIRQVQTRYRTARGIRFTRGIYSGVAFGVERTRVMLGDPDNGLPIRMYFSRALANAERSRGATQRGIIRSIGGLSYPEIKDGRPVSDNPVKDGLYEHATDALRYGCVGLYLTTKLRDQLHSAAGKSSGVNVR